VYDTLRIYVLFIPKESNCFLTHRTQFTIDFSSASCSGMSCETLSLMYSKDVASGEGGVKSKPSKTLFSQQKSWL
jgi:hypothetical protein